MTAPKPAKRREANFFYDHPALVATVVTMALIGGFIGAIYASTAGHHAPGGHPRAKPAASGAPAGSAPAAPGAPAPSAAK